MQRPLNERPLRVTDPGYRRGKRPPNYGKKFPPEVLTADEVFRLLEHPGRGPSGIRNRALVVVLWRCGLRISEALALFPKDVDLTVGFIAILHGKGNKRRLVGVDRETRRILGEWMKVRAELGVGDGSPIFCKVMGNLRGGPMRSAYVRDMLKRARKQAGIQKRVHPHGFRHTWAFELVNENTPLHVVQQALGHTALWTTEKYVSHLAPVAAMRAMQARDWPVPQTLAETGAQLDAIRDEAAERLKGLG